MQNFGVRREKHFRTRPLAQAKVFPRFQGGLLNLLKSEVGFVAEVEMQVSIMYDLKAAQRGVRWSVAAKCIQPLYGETSLLRVNLMTGDTEPME